MADRKKTTLPRDEDEAQSKRFLDLAAELEAAGDLSPTDAEENLERVLEQAAPLRKRPA